MKWRTLNSSPNLGTLNSSSSKTNGIELLLSEVELHMFVVLVHFNYFNLKCLDSNTAQIFFDFLLTFFYTKKWRKCLVQNQNHGPNLPLTKGFSSKHILYYYFLFLFFLYLFIYLTWPWTMLLKSYGRILLQHMSQGNI